MNEFIPFLQRPDAPLNGVRAAAQSPDHSGRVPDGTTTPSPLSADTPQDAFAPQDASSYLRHLEPPRYPARIAVYDDMIAPRRVVVIEPCDITDYLTQITQTVYQLMTEQGGDLPHMVIRELVENFIHASFIEPTISILDKGQTLVFSDQGPGIANKAAAVKPSFSTATSEMKYYIRGVGSGLPMVESYLKTRQGTMKIEDNLDHGTIVTVSFVHREQEAQPVAGAYPGQMQQQAQPATMMQQPPAGYGYAQAMPQQGAYPQGYGAYPQQQGMWPQGAQAQAGWGWPQAQPQQQGWQQPYPGYAQAPQPGWGQPAQQGYPAPLPQQATQQPAYGMQQMPAGYPAQAAPQPAGALPQTQATGGAGTLDPKLAQVLLAFVAEPHVGGKELAAALGISAPTASRRLKELAEAGLAAKSGQKYELTPQGTQELARLTSEDA